jgi:hypothetical protein
MRDERRRCYRYPPPIGSDDVLFWHRDVNHSAKLINFSAEGFRLRIEGELTSEIGDLARLETTNGKFLVRIANLRRGEGTVELGLLRLQEIHDLQTAVRKRRRDDAAGAQCRTLGDSRIVRFGVPMVLAVSVISLIMSGNWLGSDKKSNASSGDGKASSGPSGDRSSKPRDLGAATSTRSADRGNREAPSKATEYRTASRSADFIGKPESSASTRSSEPQAVQNSESRGSELSDQKPIEPNPAAPQLTFNARADAKKEIDQALTTARHQRKNVLLEFGAEGLGWSTHLLDVLTKDVEVSATVKKSFVFVPVEIESNRRLFETYVPKEERRGVPLLTVLDPNGKVLRNQQTGELKEGSKHDVGKVKEFLAKWSPSR